MFTEPLSVTFPTAGAVSLPRTSVGNNTASYQSSDGLVKVSASHAYGRRTRRTFRIDHSKIAADPLISAQNIKYSMSFYIVTDIPPTGYTLAQVLDVQQGFLTAIRASSDALLQKYNGGES